MALGGNAREFILKIVADIKDATKGMDDVEKASGSMKDKVMGVGKAVAGGLAIGAVVSFGKASIEAASEAQQAMNGVKAVFGDSADEIEKFSNKAVKNMGISDDAYQQFATTTGGLLKDMGVPLSQNVQMTDQLAQRGADLASVYGVDAEQAFTAIQKAMGGSFKGLKQLGVALDANEVQAYAVAQGWTDAEGNVTDAGKAMATQALIMQRTSGAAGEYAKHAGEVGNQQKTVALQMAETQEQIGNALLPVMSKLLSLIIPIVDWLAQNMQALTPLIAAIGAVVAVTWLWNAALAANPIGLIVIAIAAVVAGLIMLYQKVDWFRAAVDGTVGAIVAAWNLVWDVLTGIFNWVKDHWPLLLTILAGPIGAAVALIIKNWDTVKSVISGVIDFITAVMGTVFNIISWPFQQAVNAVQTAWGPVKDFFAGLPGAIRTFFNGLADIVTYPFRIAFDAIKSLWNSTVGGFGFDVPSWVPGVGGKSFKIPRMATGGIVTRPTIAMIGEAGPEAVIPLNRSGFGNVTIIVNALTANAEVGRRVYEALTEYERTSGKG